jgi:hypothetical protein
MLILQQIARAPHGLRSTPTILETTYHSRTAESTHETCLLLVGSMLVLSSNGLLQQVSAVVVLLACSSDPGWMLVRSSSSSSSTAHLPVRCHAPP